MNSLLQITIPKRNTHCHHHGDRLYPGTEIYSLILEKDYQIQRLDFCSSCWNILQSNEKKIEHRMFWKSKIEPHKPSLPTSRISKALDILLTLYHDSESSDEEIYVLCLYLTRMRRLALRKEFQVEKTSYHLYEILHKEEFLKVKVAYVSSQQVQTIQKSLANKLSEKKLV